MMSTDADSNDDTKSASLPADDVGDGDCYKHQSTEIIPVARDTDDHCMTESDSADCSAQTQSKHQNSPVVKQEPVHVCSVIF